MMTQSNLTFKENQAIPEGYKKTEVGVIPNDWEVLSINDFAIKVGSGKTPKGGAQIYKKSGYPFVRSQNIGWGILELSDVVYISKEIHENFHGNDLKNDDVLLNITGASIGRCAKADYRISGGNVNQHVCIIRSNTDTVNSDLLVEIINSKIVQTQINSYQAGGNREGLNFSQVRQLQIPMPKKAEEQLKIALVLNDVNGLISELEKLIEKKQAIKTATMQQLLTGKTRLPEFALREDGTSKGYKDSELGQIPEDWAVKKLSELATVKTGGTPSTSNNLYWNGGYLWCTPTDITALKGSKYLTTTSRTLSKLGIENSSAEVLPVDTIVMSSRATIGECAILKKQASTNQGFKNFICFEDTSNEYIYYLLTTLKQDFIGLCSGSTFLEISTTQVRNFKVKIPRFDEQLVISKVLSEIDTEIVKLDSKLEKVKNIKQGMMQELLIGKTRLV